MSEYSENSRSILINYVRGVDVMEFLIQSVIFTLVGFLVVFVTYTLNTIKTAIKKYTDLEIASLEVSLVASRIFDYKESYNELFVKVYKFTSERLERKGVYIEADELGDLVSISLKELIDLEKE